MSKFYLPTQKGLELFPNVIAAPPIIRWVGVDARTAEAQAILDTFGSAITAFHMQQAHNHSLSLNTQSRAFQQIAPNLGVEYVNQGGMEYITIHVQLAQPQPVVEPEAEKPVKPSTCWYPPEVSGEGSLYDMLVRSGVSLADPQPVPLWLDVNGFQFVQGVMPLGFSRPLDLYGRQVTEFGGEAYLSRLIANGVVRDDGGVPTNDPFPLFLGDYNIIGSYPGATVVVMTRSGAATFAGEVEPRRYWMVEWSGAHKVEAMFIEGHERADRGYCPTLFGWSAPRPDGYGPNFALVDYTGATEGQSGLFIQSSPPGLFGDNFAWSYVDPVTHQFVSLAADYPWDGYTY